MKYLKFVFIFVVLVFSITSYEAVAYDPTQIPKQQSNQALQKAKAEEEAKQLAQMQQDKAKMNASGFTLSQAPDTLLNQFVTQLKVYEKKFSDGAKNLFLALAIIGMVWSFSQLALKGAEFSNISFEVIRVMLVIGFFWWLIMYAPTYLFSLFDKFGNWCSGGTGAGISSSTSLLIKGFDIASKLWGDGDYVSLFNPLTLLTWLINVIFAIFILLTIVFISINMLIMNIEFVFMAYVGIFILGMAGSSWTRDTAISYLRKLLGIALSYFGLLMICNIGFMVLQSSASSLFTIFEDPESHIGNRLEAQVVMLIIFLLLAKLVNAIPNTLSSLVGGGASQGYNVTASAGAVAGGIGGAMASSAGYLGKAVGGTAFGLAKGTVLGTARAGRSILGGQFKGAGSEFASGYSGLGSFAKSMFTPKPFRTMDGGANAFSNIGKK